MELNDAVKKAIASAKIEARPYQQRLVQRSYDAFIGKNLRSVLINSPTGSGKTCVGLTICKILQEELGLRIGWVAMRRFLLAQAKDENERKGFNNKIHFLSMFDKGPYPELDMLVMDEAHHDAAGSAVHLHNVIKPKFILGLSGTPFRSDHVKLCFDTALNDAGIGMLIKDGYLSPYDHYTVTDWSPATVTRTYLREVPRWGKSVMYFHTIEQCEVAMATLQGAGVRCALVTGSSDKDTQLADFHDGKTDVLVNCFVLAEGFDCPALQTVFCRPSCKGTTIQICGRAFRKHPDVPRKNIVQSTTSKWPFIKTAIPITQYKWVPASDKQDEVNGDWRSLNVRKDLDKVNCRVLVSIAQLNVTLPAFLTKKQSRSRPARGDRRMRDNNARG